MMTERELLVVVFRVDIDELKGNYVSGIKRPLSVMELGSLQGAACPGADTKNSRGV